jgi:hypothetical protein
VSNLKMITVGILFCLFISVSALLAQTRLITPSIIPSSGYSTSSDPSGITVVPAVTVPRRNLVGSWSSGVWSLDSKTGVWANIATGIASQIAAGDIDGDGIDDMVVIWAASGLWVKYSSTGAWQFISSAPTSLAVGDRNGDHKAEIVGIWASAVWSRDGASGSWTALTTGASQIALGDLDGDSKDDLIGSWSSSGVWSLDSKTGMWANIATGIASQIVAGDINGDGRTDLLGIWEGTVWARDSATQSWMSLTSGASQITAGDLDGDGRDDLIGIWPNSGVWVKYSSTGALANLSTSVPQWITTARLPASNAGCASANGQTIDHHTDITANETWAGDGTVHKVSADISIRPGAALTLAACASVQVVQGKNIRLLSNPGSPAKFISAGTAVKPVLISNIPGSGNWGGLYSYTADSIFDLSYTTLQKGGAGNLGQGSSLYLRGNADPSTVVVPMVKADHLAVKNSVGTGIVMESGAGFTADSTDVTVTGGGSYPGGNGDSAIQLTALAAGTLPKLHVSGNAHDQIRIAESHYIARDLTIKNLGVPYYFYYDAVWFRDPTGVLTPTLTIQPGVELRFDNYLMIGDVTTGRPAYPAKLLALGTAAQPILFTSAKETKKAGDWPGIWLKAAAGSRIENARIEFAGGWNGVASANCKPVSSSDWAGLFIGWDERYIPSPDNFINVTIANSASHGVNAMWVAGTQGPDLTKAFTFENINGCGQTRNGIIGGCGKNGTGCLGK